MPFPSEKDVRPYKYDTTRYILDSEYLTFIKQYGLIQTASDVYEANYLGFYYTEFRVKYGIKALTTMSLTENGSTFDNDDLGPWVNLCSGNVCFGSNRSVLDVKVKE